MQKSLFAPAKLSATPVTNRAGGAAYDLGAKEALAQLAVTGTFNNTFYTSGVDQMARIKELTGKVEPAFLAKLAVYSRRRGFMKDMPIFLLGLVSGQAAQTKKLQVEAHQIKDMGTAARRQLEGAQLAAMIAEALPKTDEHLAHARISSASGSASMARLRGDPRSAAQPGVDLNRKPSFSFDEISVSRCCST